MVFDFLSYTSIFFVPALIIWLVFTFTTRSTRFHLPPCPKPLPIIGHLHLLDRVPYKSFHDLTTSYGPLIHLCLGSVPCIVASSPELAKELLSTNELTFASRPISMAVHHLTYNSSGFAFAPYGPQWKFMRKLCMSNLLGGRTLTQFHHIRKDELRQLVQLLVEKSTASEAVDLSEEFVKLSNNIISRMMLSIRYSGTHNQAEEARFLAREVGKIFGYLNLSDFIWLIRNFDFQRQFKKSKDVRIQYDTLLEKIIKEREEVRKNKEVVNGEGVRDFLDTLLDIYEDGNEDIELSRDQIKAFVLDIFTAGTDTSAAATEWAMSELINHPKIFEKARKEIDSVVGKNNRLVEESDLPRLPYIQAIFKESLRLHPPIPVITRESRQDCNIGGYHIPANTILFLNAWSIHRDPQNWTEPLQFRPERFMSDSDHQSSSDVRGQHFNLLPFGTGRRGCPGMWLVLQQVPTMLAALIQCFDWKIGSPGDGIKLGTVDMVERPGLTVPRANALVLVPITHFNPFSNTT